MPPLLSMQNPNTDQKMGEGEEIHVAEDERVNISLKDLSKKLEEFAKARDWEKYHSPRNLLLAMVNNLPHYFSLNIYIYIYI